MRLGRIALPWREWVPAALVSALVLTGGSRLIVLSTQQRIAENRQEAADVAERTASRIEGELDALAERARREAARAVEVLGPSHLLEGFGSIAPDEESFWTATDGSIVPAVYGTDAAAREALARAWSGGDRESVGVETEWLAPLRHGSQWLVAARAPILTSNDDPVEHAGWAVVYRPLEEMLLEAGIDELPEDGYELAFGQHAPGDALRLLTGSPFVTSLDHVTGLVRLPDASRATGSSEAYLVLALRPRSGWYSPARLTANVALLLVVTWLLGLGAHDLVASQARWRAALAVARQRLLATNRRLTEELEQSRRLQLSFEHARFHDTFTGLPNRRYFMNQLDQALRAVRGGRRQQIAVILVDIDRFKLVNDTLGQTAGDDLMVQVARRFENKIGEDPSYVLARWSGDQFALLLFDVHSSDTAVTFAKLLRDALVRPFILRRHTLRVAAHTGITCVDTELQRTEDVVREADIALSVAKRREGADPVLYEAALGADAVSTVSLEADLHVALERKQFLLLFQPIVDLATGTVVGAEALLRWRHPIEGLLTPDRFLPIAEHARLIVPISRWVIRRACTLGGEWRRYVRPDASFYVSVNLAATVLDDPHLVQYVAGVLHETGLPAESLRFEITEADLTPHVGAARDVLEAFHDMGIGLVLDDFGTGHSSLSYLELFPIDCVKIDRPFVNPADGSDSDVMRSVVHMAASLGLEAVAEKVETETAVEALKRMGCKYGQGYLLGDPVESEHLLARLEGRVPTPATPDAPTLPQPAVPGPVAPYVPTIVLRAQPDTAAPVERTIEAPGPSAPATPDAPTLNVPAPPALRPADAERRTAPPAPDAPTLVLPRARERTAPDAPTLVQPALSEPVAPEIPTLVHSAPLDLVAPDTPTVVLRAGGMAADETAVEALAASDAAAADAPTPSGATAFHEAPTVEHRVAVLEDEAVAAALGDEASDSAEPTALLEAPAEASEDDSPTQTRVGRRWLRHASGT